MRTKILSLPIILIALSTTAWSDSPAVYTVGTTASLRVWVHSEAKLSINGHPIEAQDSGHGYRLLTLPGLSPRQLKKITVAVTEIPHGAEIEGMPLASVWVRPGGAYDIVFAPPAPDGIVVTADAKAGKIRSSAQAEAEGKADEAKADEGKNADAKDADAKAVDDAADETKTDEAGQTGADAPPAPQPEEPAAEDSAADVEPLPTDTQVKTEQVPAPEPEPIEDAGDSSE